MAIRSLDEQTEEHRYLHGPWRASVYETCDSCNYDRHECQACGEWLYHGTGMCGPDREAWAEEVAATKQEETP